MVKSPQELLQNLHRRERFEVNIILLDEKEKTKIFLLRNILNLGN